MLSSHESFKCRRPFGGRLDVIFVVILFEGIDTAALGATALFSFPHDGQYLNAIYIREPQLKQNMAVTLKRTKLTLRREICGVAGRGRLSLFRHLFRCFDIYFGVSTSISVFFKLKNIFVYFEIYLCVLKYICVL